MAKPQRESMIDVLMSVNSDLLPISFQRHNTLHASGSLFGRFGHAFRTREYHRFS